jgi:hypothetical protein
LCGSPQAAGDIDVNAPDVKSFCEVMKNPTALRDKPITLAANAYVFPAGILLQSDQCNADVSVHFEKNFERQSNAKALAQLKRVERQLRVSIQQCRAESQAVVVVFEGRLTKNPDYYLKFDRGAQTLAAWNYHQEYAFVVKRIFSLRRLS